MGRSLSSSLEPMFIALLLLLSYSAPATSFSERGLMATRTAPRLAWRTVGRSVVEPQKTGTVETPASKAAELDEVKAASPSEAVLDDKDDGHMSIPKLLREYGFIALFFHFSVWISSVTVVYSILSTGFELEMPEALQSLFGNSSPAEEADFAEAATAGVGAARVAATLALVEAVGPLRLGLTVAATPSVSKWARQYAAVRRAEGFLMARWEQASAAIAGFFGRGGGKGQ